MWVPQKEEKKKKRKENLAKFDVIFNIISIWGLFRGGKRGSRKRGGKVSRERRSENFHRRCPGVELCNKKVSERRGK